MRMDVKHEFDGFLEYKSVLIADVEVRVLTGWTLLAIVEQDEVVTRPARTADGWDTHERVTDKLRVARCLFGLNRDDTVEELKAEVEYTKKRLEAAVSETTKIRADRDSMANIADKIAGQLKDAEAGARSNMQKVESLLADMDGVNKANSSLRRQLRALVDHFGAAATTPVLDGLNK